MWNRVPCWRSGIRSRFKETTLLLQSLCNSVLPWRQVGSEHQLKNKWVSSSIGGVCLAIGVFLSIPFQVGSEFIVLVLLIALHHLVCRNTFMVVMGSITLANWNHNMQALAGFQNILLPYIDWLMNNDYTIQKFTPIELDGLKSIMIWLSISLGLGGNVGLDIGCGLFLRRLLAKRGILGLR